MAKKFKLGILRARNDTSPVIADRACIDYFMTGQKSVMKYWSDTTGGHLDFIDSEMFRWVDVTINPASTGRLAQAQAAVAAVRAANPGFDPLAGFDGLVVLSYPGRGPVVNPLAGQPGQPATVIADFDGGKTEVDGLNCAVLPVSASSHTFMCHELGHVLGLARHTFGVDNNGTDWAPDKPPIIVGPEYGSPYDIMSAESFGSRWLGAGPTWTSNPIFNGPAVPGWPGVRGTSMGPHLSRAYLHQQWPDALAGQIIDRQFPVGNGSVRARLSPPRGGRAGSLLVLHPPGEPAPGIGRVYVEYRPGTDWDAGLDQIGTDLARAGIAVHMLVDQPGVGPVIWYQGSIPLNTSDTDVDIPAAQLVVTLDSHDDGSAEVQVRRFASRTVTITTANQSDDIIAGTQTTEEQTPCGDVIIRGTWTTQSFCQFMVSTTGFGGAGAPLTAAPTIGWTVSGVPVSGASGTVTVPFEGVQFDAQFTIDPVSFELSLSSRGGEKYTAVVVATVVGTGASASAIFTSLGFFNGFRPEDVAILAKCLGKFANRLWVRPQRFRRPDPEPAFGPRFGPVVVEPGLAWQNRALLEIQQIPGLDAAGAHALEQIVRLQGPG